jgi:hypothetical protein
MECLRNPSENDMVRHECAEALGSIATPDISGELAKYLDADQVPILPNTIFPNLHIYVRVSHKYV